MATSKKKSPAITYDNLNLLFGLGLKAVAEEADEAEGVETGVFMVAQ